MSDCSWLPLDNRQVNRLVAAAAAFAGAGPSALGRITTPCNTGRQDQEVTLAGGVEAATSGAGDATLTAPDLQSITDSVVEAIRSDAEFASRITEQLGLPGGAALRTIEEIIANDDDYAVEFKSTARWDLREGIPNRVMEDAIVKTVAAFLNTDGGTLLIGVDTPNRCGQRPASPRALSSPGSTTPPA